MKNFTPALVVMLVGAMVAGGAAVALVKGNDAGGGRIVPVTQKAPPMPKHERGIVRNNGTQTALLASGGRSTR